MTGLGMDELVKILSRVPAKAVIKACSLSKSLFSLLSSDFFIRRQTILSSRLDCGLFILPTYSLDNPEFHLLPGEKDGATGIPPDSLSFIHKKGYILGCSQGLVLLLGYDGKELVICNPATRKCVALATPKRLLSRLFLCSSVVFECHPTSLGSYNIVSKRIHGGDDDWTFDVYCNGRWEDTRGLTMAPSFDVYCNNDDWTMKPRLSEHDPVALFKDKGLVLHYLYGILGREDYIVAYDMKQKHTRFDLPKSVANVRFSTRWSIFKWKRTSSHHEDTIGVATTDEYKMFTVWVLEDYEQGSWRMVLRKTPLEMGVPPPPSPEEEEEYMITYCCVASENLLVFIIGCRLYSYEMEGTNVGRLQVVVEHDTNLPWATLSLYSNTLHPI